MDLLTLFSINENAPILHPQRTRRASKGSTINSDLTHLAILSLKAGMNVLHLQSLLGHSTLEMTRRYVEMVKDDLSEAHREHGPIDRFL